LSLLKRTTKKLIRQYENKGVHSSTSRRRCDSIANTRARASGKLSSHGSTTSSGHRPTAEYSSRGKPTTGVPCYPADEDEDEDKDDDNFDLDEDDADYQPQDDVVVKQEAETAGQLPSEYQAMLAAEYDEDALMQQVLEASKADEDVAFPDLQYAMELTRMVRST
jgi:hypothetical protein